MTSSTPNPTANPLALITQLCAGPSFREVATEALRPALQALYPSLAIDPELLLVVTPEWEIQDETPAANHLQLATLSGTLTRQAIADSTTVYTAGEQFLSRAPLTHPPLQLPVHMPEIAQQLNTLAPLMLTAYQEQQLAFWNSANSNDAPRWQALSNTLRNYWNVTQIDAWDSDECTLARQLFLRPQASDRQVNDAYASKAYLVDVQQTVAGVTRHRTASLLTVLTGTLDKRQVVLAHSLSKGYEQFDSLEQLGDSIPARLGPLPSGASLTWQLYEPAGNLFDYQACALIGVQIDAIGQIDFAGHADTSAADHPVNGVPGAQHLVAPVTATTVAYQDALPDWLKQASSADLSACSRYLKDLAALHSLNAGRTFDDDIPAIQAFTKAALRDAMIKEHPDAAHLNLDQVQFTVRHLKVWGTLVLPGEFEKTTCTLVELALDNLTWLSLGERTLSPRDGAQLPDWLTVDYVKQLIGELDIGSTYPALIKHKLLDDPATKATRQQQYISHLRLQLPLLALQYKLLGEAGVDALGYRYVAALMAPEAEDRQVDGHTIVIRPLAFTPQRSSANAVHTVSNMFVIGTETPGAGPCLLYRPLLEPPLTQYPSHANLLYDIEQSSSLRESVLAWLPDDVRNDYASYVFPTQLPLIDLALDTLLDPVKVLTMTGPVLLRGQALAGDALQKLYQDNAKALTQLADRQSVSNAERRWATLKQAGWAIFNCSLPYLGRTVGAAAWIWQIIDDLKQAGEQTDNQARWAVLTDALLNLGMAITLHVAARSKPAARPAEPLAPKQTPVPEVPVKPVAATRLPDISAHDLPHGPLHTSGALSQKPTTLAATLDRFKVTKPEGLGPASTEADAHQHLYSLGEKWYAPVGTRWFEVQVDDNGNVLITDPMHANRTGPILTANRQGQWFVDTRLRLRGGGLRARQKATQQKNLEKAKELQGKLKTFDDQRKSKQTQLQQRQTAMEAATPGTSRDALREQYLSTLEQQRNELDEPRRQLHALIGINPVPDYQTRMLGYLRAQLELTQKAINATLADFNSRLKTTLEFIERQTEVPQERHIADTRSTRESNQAMINRLQYMETHFNELKAFGKQGAWLTQWFKQNLPAYKLDSLKAFQVTLARNLCLVETSTRSLAVGWSAVDEIVNQADRAIASLLDTLNEHNRERLNERIEALNNLMEQFSMVDESLQDLPQEYPEQALTSNIEQLRTEVDAFKQRCTSSLLTLLDEKALLPTRPDVLNIPPRPTFRFIRSRSAGIIVGRPRLSPVGLDTGMVDILSPLTDKVIATFHEKSPGIWVEHLPPRVETPPAPVVDLQISLNAGQALLDSLGAFIARTLEHAKDPNRTPMGIEKLFHQHAQSLEQASEAIENALTASNATDTGSYSAAVVNKALNDGTRTLYQFATSTTLNMIKSHAPTADGLQWLLLQKRVSLQKVRDRQPTKDRNKEFLDEYAIKELSTNKTLWYAHFTYLKARADRTAFIRAYLLTPQQQQRASLPSTQRLSPRSQIAAYRREISQELAQQWFFSQ